MGQKITVRFDAGLHAEVRALSIARDCSFSWLVQRCVRAALPVLGTMPLPSLVPLTALREPQP